MTDLSQSPNQQSTDVEEAEVIEETTETTEISEKPVKTGLLWFVTFINFLILLLVCAGAYWYYTQIADVEANERSEVATIQQNLDEQNRNLQGNIAELKQNAITFKNQFTATQQSNQDRLAQVQQNVNNVQHNIDNNSIATKALTTRIAELSGRRPSDWLLAEANYLVNMAARKLYLEKDVVTSTTLLQEADARLNDLDDPSLFSVRALIAADIQTLGQINTVSTNSIALEFAGMMTKVSLLPLDKLQLPESDTNEDLTLSEDISDWRQNLAKTWQSIVADLITIDYVDKPLEPYLAERQQWLIEQQLKHALAQAQTAAMSEQIDIYRASIQQGIDLINTNYQLDDSEVGQFLAMLKELQAIDFSRNYPSSLASQASLKDIVEQRVKGLYQSTVDNQENVGNSQ